MKKIFLTSGLAIIMASSALAANDINYNSSTNPPSYTLANDAGNPSCQEPTLGNYTGPSTFYAKWEAKTYNINYAAGTARNLDGNTTAAHIHTPATPQNAVTQQTATYDSESPAILDNMFTTPAGYQFAGWKGNYNASGTATAYDDTTHTGGTSYTVGNTINPYKVVGNLTLTATWTPLNYNVIYNKGAHAASGVNNYTDPNGAQYDKNYTALTGGGENASASTTGIYAAPGYTFRGWSRSSSSTYTSAQDSWIWTGETPWHETEALTVYAIYSANPYTITYYPGVAKTALYSHNVSGTETTQNVTFDAGVTTKNNNSTDLTGGAWSQTGYTFAGWRSDHDLLTNATSSALANDNTEGGYVYGAGVSNINATPLTYKVPGNTKMYAIWAPNKSGIITLDSSVYPSNDFHETAKYTTSTGVTATSPATVVSIYETGLWPSTVEQMTAANKIQSFPIPSKTGYTFNGFYESNGTTQVISNTGAIVNDNALRSVTTEGDSTKVWYAKWTPKPGKIEYDCGTKPSGASTTVSGTAPDPLILNYDEGYTLATNAPNCTLPGYHFKGWKCSHDISEGTAGDKTYTGSGSVNTYSVSQSGTFKVVGTVTCSVVWEANTITTNWNANGGTLTNQGLSTCTYDGSIGIPTTIPNRPGYDFNGWTTTAPSSGS